MNAAATLPSPPAYGLTFVTLDREVLARVAREEGVDRATTLFYELARSCPRNGPWIRSVDALTGPAGRLGGKVVIVPAACYREFPRIGADGALIREVAAGFGLEVETAPLLSRGPVRANAEILRRFLGEQQRDDLVLVSLSKGGSDLRIALEREPELACRARAWVQICGLIHGSPLVDARVRPRSWSHLTEKVVMGAAGAGAALWDLTHAPGSLLSEPAVAPPGLQVINVVACPLAEHVGPRVRRRYQELAPLGPNDGSTLLADAIVRPGWVYPVLGADHYFQTPQAPGLLRKLFRHLYAEGLLPEAGNGAGG